MNINLLGGLCRLTSVDGIEMVLCVRSVAVKSSVGSLSTVEIEGIVMETGNVVKVKPLPEAVRRAISLGVLK